MRIKHESQVKRWSRQALRTLLLAGLVAALLSLHGSPQNAQAGNAQSCFVSQLDTQRFPIEQQIRAELLKRANAAAAPAGCAKCGESKPCCCGDPAKCSCEK